MNIRRLVIVSSAIVTTTLLFSGCGEFQKGMDAGYHVVSPSTTTTSVAASATPGAPIVPLITASALPPADAAFLATLDAHGVHYASPASAIAMGNLLVKSYNQGNTRDNIMVGLVYANKQLPTPYSNKDLTTILDSAIAAYGNH